MLFELSFFMAKPKNSESATTIITDAIFIICIMFSNSGNRWLFIDSVSAPNAVRHILRGELLGKDQSQGRRVAPPLGAILFYRAIKEYAEKGARLLASHCLWHWLVPCTPVIQAALAKLGLTPSNIPRFIGLNYLRSGGVTREE